MRIDHPGDVVLEAARSRGVIRPRDVADVPNARWHLRRLTEHGLLIKVGRGLYSPASAERPNGFALLQATSRVRGIVCLVSALEFHGFTTQVGYEVWIAVNHTGHLTVRDVPVRIIRMTGTAFDHGCEEHRVGGGVVRVYSAAKTVADCFRFRSKVGLDVAIESLREGWKARLFTVEELLDAARAVRITTVIQPYMEATLS